MNFNRKDILGLQEMSREEIEYILDTAVPFKEITLRPIKKIPTLRGKTVINLFYEPSTRTRTSFELAGKRMSADVINISTSVSSVVKGESLKDTALTLQALGADVVIIRHSMAGAPHLVGQTINAGVINAGDGTHEHPTQALLDLYTIREKKGQVAGLKVAIVGDILHSRVARSDIWGLTKMGAEVVVAGPNTLLPPELQSLGIKVYTNVAEAIKNADVIQVLRIQQERQEKGLFPSLREYSRLYGINQERLKYAAKDVLVMHPGPINRGVEITPDVADSAQSAILDQVTNGLAIRMALLYLLAGGGGEV